MFNLSGKDLAKEELQVLDKGLKYAPKRNFDKFQTYIGLQKYVRKLNIKKYILGNPMTYTRTTQTNEENIHSNYVISTSSTPQ